MKVFISWSGKRSRALAVALKEWLPLILQYAKPWVSDKDIAAGDRWAQAIAGELESSNFGILCVTPENIKSEWILFEAGALSKSMLDAKVIPLLFGLELSDLSGPLSQFQAQKVDQSGLMNVVQAINAVAETKAQESTIDQLVPALWPQLQQKLDEIPEKEPELKQVRPQAEILEELVTQVRGLGSRMREFDPETVDRDARFLMPRSRELSARALDEMMHFVMENGEERYSLAIIAGLVRDSLPWLSEVLLEANRDLRAASSPMEAREIAHRLTRIVHSTLRGPFGERHMMKNKGGHFLMMELPHFIERAISMKVDAFQFPDEPTTVEGH